MRPPAAPALLAATCLALAGASGCGFLKSIVGANTVDLAEAEVKAMGVDLRRTQKTICPREPVQMAVLMDVKLKGEDEARKVQTWTGRGHLVNKNGKLDFEEFAFHSDEGTFDPEGWFTPAPDLRVTVAREFELITAFKKRPDKFTFTTKYKPDYGCIRGGGTDGAPGSSGEAGRSGQDGTAGSNGGSGSDGGPGAPGGSGASGGAGPQIQLFATMVKTPFYDRLVAVRIEGAAQDFLLFAPEQSISVHASGGAGGAGGPGGGGGRGGSGGSGTPGGDGGKGGPGGNGGNGGNGGPGGTVTLTYDAHFPELQKLIAIDVGGGPPGAAGAAGGPGGGGSAGSGQQNTPSGRQGPDGTRGAEGAAGQSGPKGTASAKAGKVAERFKDVPGVTAL